MRKLLLILSLIFTPALAFAQEPNPALEDEMNSEIVVNGKIRITLRGGQWFESYCGNNEKPYQSLVSGLSDSNKKYVMIPMIDKNQRLQGYTTILKSEITSTSYILIYGKVEPGDIGELGKLLDLPPIVVPPKEPNTPDAPKGPPDLHEHPLEPKAPDSNDPGPPDPDDEPAPVKE